MNEKAWQRKASITIDMDMEHVSVVRDWIRRTILADLAPEEVKDFLFEVYHRTSGEL